MFTLVFKVVLAMSVPQAPFTPGQSGASERRFVNSLNAAPPRIWERSPLRGGAAKTPTPKAALTSAALPRREGIRNPTSEPPRSTKPWLDNPAAYFSEHSDRRWVIGRSSVVCLSASEATDSACRDASRQLALLYAGAGRAAPAGAPPPDDLTRRLAAELDSRRLIRDRYFERVKKPYGEVWTAAVLVDASDDALRAIAAEDIKEKRERIVAGARRAAIVAGLGVAILLFYAGLNSLTRGYFRGRLRICAAACMLGIVLILHLGLTG